MSEIQKEAGELLDYLKTTDQQQAVNDLTALLSYVEGISQQLIAASQELAQVRGQLDYIQSHSVKARLEQAVKVVDRQVHRLQERLVSVKDKIVRETSKMLDNVKQFGISALDKTVSFMGIKDTLNAMEADLSHTIKDARKTIAQIETIGKELRGVGGHLTNAGRAVAGMDLKPVREDEGRFQAAILAPMRTAQKLFIRMENTTLSAIGSVERLHQAAEQGREKRAAAKVSVHQSLNDLKEAEKPPVNVRPRAQEAAR